MSNFPIQTNIPIFSPRRRLYEPEATIPWPRPGFHGLSSVCSACEVLQRQHSIPAKSRQGGPLFHLAYMKHVPLNMLLFQ